MEYMTVPVSSFIEDFLKHVDEIRSEDDVVRIWHVEKSLALKLFSLLEDIFAATSEVSYAPDNSDSESDECHIYGNSESESETSLVSDEYDSESDSWERDSECVNSTEDSEEC